MPILILTGRNRIEDRVQCLDLGADDYLVKPFSFTELSARIRALLRRSHLPAESTLQIEDLKLDRVERLVERSGKRIELTSKEFALLEYLMRNAGRRITRAMIIEHVWNLSFDTCTNVVDVYINYGVGAANLIFLPVAGKLKIRMHEEYVIREMTIEGVVSILEGMNPRILETKLLGFLADQKPLPRETKAAAAAK
jgi:hypothetical protein